MKKQRISVLLLLSLLLGLLPFGAAAAGNPFTDVKASQYYYDAVLWAVEKGVTNGTSATTLLKSLIKNPVCYAHSHCD